MVPDNIRQLAEAKDWREVVVFAGAGLSAASGIPTFRGAGGYYQGRDAASLASPEGFRRDPVLVWNWYAMRIRAVRHAVPNAGHFALAKLPGCQILTSNVDDLLDRAGVEPIRLHGDILEMRGLESGRVFEIDDREWTDEFELETLPRLPDGELARPNVVWFGEYPWKGPFEVVEKLDRESLYIEVGTSGVVSYGFTEFAARAGCGVIRINPEAEGYPGVACWRESSERALPALVDLFVTLL